MKLNVLFGACVRAHISKLMQVIESNDVKIYNVTSGKSIPEWVTSKQAKKLLKKDGGNIMYGLNFQNFLPSVDIKRKIDLLQGFEMPDITTSIEISPNNQFIMTTGTYRPRIRCYDVNELSIKFDRCIDHQPNKMKFISDDASKTAVMRADRVIEFHTLGNVYYSLRIPKYGRDLLYDTTSGELNIAGSGNQVYRLSLYAGQFLKPYSIEDDCGMNCCSMNYDLQLLGVGTEKGCVVCFDSKNEKYVAKLNVASFEKSHFYQTNSICEVTSVTFDGTMHMIVGTSTGRVYLYDIRNNQPFAMRDHKYGDPIQKIYSIHSTNLDEHVVASCDKHCVKLWSKNNSDLFTTLETENNINDFIVYPNSGLFLFANESPKCEIYFVPGFDPAPRWCSFLDNIAEELEESNKFNSNTASSHTSYPNSFLVYDDFKFITNEELEELDLVHLKGTHQLKPALHGFYIDDRVYAKARAAVLPTSYELHKKERLKLKMEQERQDRVKLFKLPDVNSDLATNLLSKKTKITQSDLVNPLGDPRFTSLFSNPDFQIDLEADEYKLIKSISGKRKNRKNKPIAEILGDAGDHLNQLDVDDRLLKKMDIGNFYNDKNEAIETKSLNYNLVPVNDAFSLDSMDLQGLPLGEKIKKKVQD